MPDLLLAILGTAAVFLLGALVAANLSTPERKLVRTPKRLYGTDAPDFRRALGVLLGPGLTTGNRVDTLQNGDAIFPAMLEAIRGARASVTFETFIFRDEIAERFCDALAEPAGRGVRVHVLLDWVGSRDSDESAIQCLRDAGAEVHVYHPPRFKHLGRMNNRTHRKVLVVDGRVGFTGGVGVGREWEGDAQDPEHWRETHYRVEGPVVAQMQAVFVDNWIEATGTVLHGERYFPKLEPRGELDAQMFASSPAGGSASLHLMVLLAITAARRTIDIENSYFVPDSLTIEALCDACSRGVRVRILVPNRHTDAKLGRWAAHGLYQPLLDAGADIREYEPTMIHCKLLVVDGEWSSVGSMNFDDRSFRLNDEANLNVFGRAFAAEQVAMMEADLAKSKRISPRRWKRRAFTQRLYERTALLLRSQL